MALVGLVEDDINIQRSVRIFLSSQGFDIYAYSSAETFLKEGAQLSTYDVLLLDINLPGQSGVWLCEQLKKKPDAPAIIMITARNDESTAVKCFELGADDFVRKPFGLAELKSRISRVIEVNRKIENQVHSGGFVLEPKSRQLTGFGKTMRLTRSEFLILQYLLNRPGAKISRHELATKLSLTDENSDRTLDVHISRIRTKFKDVGLTNVSIQSIYGEGYILEIKS